MTGQPPSQAILPAKDAELWENQYAEACSACAWRCQLQSPVFPLSHYSKELSRGNLIKWLH